MKPNDHWHKLITADARLPAEASQQLQHAGFVILPGPIIPSGSERLSKAYDDAVAAADPADIAIRSSTRVRAFVNAGPEFDGIYIYPPLLAACCQIIGRPFKLSGMRARTLEPGAPMEPLHVDVKHQGDGWPIVGFMLMVDPFNAENGATRFVPGSHLQPREPGEVVENLTTAHDDEVLACGPATSMIIFNGSVWHSHTSNRSLSRRRSVQGHFIPREARASTDHRARLRPETLRRLDELAKYVLDCAA